MLANWDLGDAELTVDDSISLVEETLAFFLSDDDQKEILKQLFGILARNLIESVVTPNERQAYGKTLFGIEEAKAIRDWVHLNRERLDEAEGASDLLAVLWEVLSSHMKNEILGKFDPPDVLRQVSEKWLLGESFAVILQTIESLGGKMIWGTQRRNFKIDQVVETCENGFSFDGSLVIGAVIEFLDLADSEGTEQLRADLQDLQKRLKYGLPNEAAVTLYEMGFADRFVAMSIAEAFSLQSEDKDTVLSILRRDSGEAMTTVEDFPVYFQDRMKSFVSS